MPEQFSTINALIQNSITKYGSNVALRYKEKKEFLDITYSDLAKRVYAMASGFAASGMQKGDRIALLSENRPEWAVTDLAILAIGGVVVPMYPTLPPPQIAYIVRNSGAKALVVSDAKQLKKALEIRQELPDLILLVAMDAGPVSEEDNVVTYASLIEKGQKEPLGEEKFRQIVESAQPEDLASLVYTSGTTGDPKGAMLTHWNIASNVQNALENFRRNGEEIKTDDTFLSFLPLCHVFERTTGYYLPLAAGGTVAYCEGVRTIMPDMQAAQPTLMVCVPRVYEAMQERILDEISKKSEIERKLATKALEAGKAPGYSARRSDARTDCPGSTDDV
jgi:long-chain acyl-CoA synthetase